MKKKIDIKYSNGIHVRLNKAKGADNIQIILYDENDKKILSGPYLSPEVVTEKLNSISKSKDLKFYLRTMNPSPVIDTPDYYYNPADWM